MELFELIQTLSSAHGPSGDDADIRNILSELASPMADEVAWDTM